MQKLWRPFNNYEVNTTGIVRNPRTGQAVKPWIDKGGYYIVGLLTNKVHKQCRVHRLVAMTFPDLVEWTEDAKGRPFEELTVNHLNEDKSDNRVENLQWCPLKYNLDYGTHRERVAKAQSKVVYQCTPDGELVNTWTSTNECGRNGFNQGAVAACCRGERKTHKGFRWSYNPPQ